MSDEASAERSERAEKRLQTAFKRILGTTFASFFAWSVFSVGVTLFLLRACMAFAPFFEARANAWLEGAFDAHLSGLEGAWHGITPKIHIERIEFEQGSIEDIVVELDLPRSLLALFPRVKALEIGSASITFAEDFGLIESLLGTPGGMDLRSVLATAKRLAGNLEMRVGAHDEAMLLQWIVHTGSESRGRIWLRPQRGPHVGETVEQAGLVFGFDIDRSLIPEQIEGALWGQGQLHIPAAFASLMGLAGTISALDASVRISDGQVAARVNMDASMLRIGDHLIDSASVFAKGAGTPLSIRGEFQQARLRHGSDSLDFSGSRFHYQGGDLLQFDLPDQDIRRLTEFAVATALKETALARWSARFRPAGRMYGISGQVRAGAPLMLGANLEDFSSESWMGGPALRNVSAKAVYAAGSARLLIDSKDAGLDLPKLFEQETLLARASGEVWVRFLPGYVGVQGHALRARLASGGEIVVNLSYSAPVDPAERQIACKVEAFAVDPADALQFVPKNLPEGMRAWLDSGIEGGEIEQGEIVVSGYVRRQPPIPTMQVEMWLDWRDGALAYHPRWPAAQSVSGRITLRGGVISGRVERARLLDMRIEDLTFEMPLRGRSVRLADAGEMPADGLLRLLFSSPLGDMLPVESDQLEAVGLADYRFVSRVPFQFNFDDFELDLGLRLQDADFNVRAKDDETRRFSLTEVNGSVDYVFPDQLRSDGIDGTMFGQALNVGLRSGESSFDDGWRIQADVRSRISAEFLRPYIGTLARIDGDSDYAALVEIDALGEAAPRVHFHSDLQGLKIDLPPGLGKEAGERAPLLVDLELRRGLAAGTALFSMDKRVGGVVHWQDGDSGEAQLDGVIAFGGEHSSVDVLASSGQGVQIYGGLPLLSLDDLRSFTAGVGPRPDLHFHGFELGEMDLGSFTLGEVTVDGLIGAHEVDVHMQGDTFDGTWTSAGDGYGQLSLARLHLMAADEQAPTGVGDLLGEADPAALPEIDVSIDSLKLAGNDYGAWKFGLRQTQEGVRFVELAADSRGLSIRAADDLIWRQLPDGSHESRFVGELATNNLAEAMAGWGFAPSVEAERAVLVADLTWADVPWKPKLQALAGDIDLIIRRGRFRELEAGAGMRLLTLLDFNAFLKRLAFDFSDAFGEGVAFDEVNAKSQFEQGVMRMVEPVRIDGNGGRFRIGGTINLVSGELDNQFEATLKISRSLPWLAAYMALLGNPVTGLSVVFGERILRDRLEDFSTARYSVTGTLSEPVFSLAEVEAPEPLPEELLDPAQASPDEADPLEPETTTEDTEV